VEQKVDPLIEVSLGVQVLQSNAPESLLNLPASHALHGVAAVAS
jgi:hypothetical protein